MLQDTVEDALLALTKVMPELWDSQALARRNLTVFRTQQWDAYPDPLG